MSKTESEQQPLDKPSWSWRRRFIWGGAGLTVFAAVIIGGSYWYVSTLTPEEVLSRVDKPTEAAEAVQPANEQTAEQESDEPSLPTAPGGHTGEDGAEQVLANQPTGDGEPSKAVDESATGDTSPATTAPPTQEPLPPTPPTKPGGESPNQPSEPSVQPEQPTASAKKSGIDAKYDGQLQALQNSCNGKMQSLVGQIVGDLKADSDLQQIQGGYMGKVSAAESECDSQFQSIMSKAQADYKQAGIAASEMPGWKSAYESAKAAARASALSSILNAASE